MEPKPNPAGCAERKLFRKGDFFSTLLMGSSGAPSVSAATSGVTAPVSLLKAWYSLMMPSQCRLSSRTDQLTIWPMPFILFWRGKFISIAKLANSWSPSVKPPNIARVRAISSSLSTPNCCI